MKQKKSRYHAALFFVLEISSRLIVMLRQAQYDVI